MNSVKGMVLDGFTTALTILQADVLHAYANRMEPNTNFHFELVRALHPWTSDNCVINEILNAGLYFR